ncbi:MAG: hypothetical protein ACK56I_16130, partial [bacterium]
LLLVFEHTPRAPLGPFTDVGEVDEEIDAFLLERDEVFAVTVLHAGVAVGIVQHGGQRGIAFGTENADEMLSALVANETKAVGFGHSLLRARPADGFGYRGGR